MPSRCYEFRVDGALSDRVRSAFPEMEIYDIPPQTIIKGRVVDESHLHGVLALIQTLGLRLVSVHEVS